MHRTSNATSAGLNPAVGTKFISNFNYNKMKHVETSAFIWSAEDHDSAVERLFDNGVITESTREKLLSKSEDEKLEQVRSTIIHSEGWLMEVINDMIYSDLYDYFANE